MQHHELCTSWPHFHPYDCPECKILVLADARLSDMYTAEEYEDAYQNGYSEGEDDAEWNIESKKEHSYNEGIQYVLDNPDEYNLYSEAQWKAKYANH